MFKLFTHVPHQSETYLTWLREVAEGPRGLNNWRPVIKKRRILKPGDEPTPWELMVDYLDRCYSVD